LGLLSAEPSLDAISVGGRRFGVPESYGAIKCPEWRRIPPPLTYRGNNLKTMRKQVWNFRITGVSKEGDMGLLLLKTIRNTDVIAIPKHLEESNGSFVTTLWFITYLMKSQFALGAEQDKMFVFEAEL